MSDYYGSIHCTQLDIVEEGQAPFLMSLPQMRNLRFSLNLTPGNASLTCDPLGIYHLPLDTSRSSHLVLDLEVMAEYMYNVEFQVQRVSFFTQHVHSDTAIMHKENLHKSLDLLTSKMRLLPIFSLLKKHLLQRINGYSMSPIEK